MRCVATPASASDARKPSSAAGPARTAATWTSCPALDSPRASVCTTRSRPPTSAGATTCSRTTRPLRQDRGGRGRGQAAADALVADERIDEELRCPAQGLVRSVFAAERERALDAAAQPGVATRAILSGLEEAQHGADGRQPLLLPGDLEEPQPDVRHLRLSGQAAPRDRRPPAGGKAPGQPAIRSHRRGDALRRDRCAREQSRVPQHPADRKSTRLNSSHGSISYAVFCLKKKKK